MAEDDRSEEIPTGFTARTGNFCEFHGYGVCRYGRQCRHSHDIPDAKAEHLQIVNRIKVKQQGGYLTH